MKRFMYLSIGVLCLMLAVVAGYHLGSQTALAQAPEAITGYRVESYNAAGYHFVMLSNGDVYKRDLTLHDDVFGGPLKYLGNYWGGAPVPTSNESWGTIKSNSR